MAGRSVRFVPPQRGRRQPVVGRSVGGRRRAGPLSGSSAGQPPARNQRLRRWVRAPLGFESRPRWCIAISLASDVDWALAKCGRRPSLEGTTTNSGTRPKSWPAQYESRARSRWRRAPSRSSSRRATTGFAARDSAASGGDSSVGRESSPSSPPTASGVWFIDPCSAGCALTASENSLTCFAECAGAPPDPASPVRASVAPDRRLPGLPRRDR